MATAKPKAPPKTTKPGTAVAVSRAKVNLPALPENLQEQMDSEIAAFQNRLSAPGGDRIKVSQEKLFELPNGDTSDELDCIIVDFVSFNAYYEGAYNPNNITPPKCFAIGLEPTGMIPSANSPECQAESCTACWANAWKSGTGNGKACNNTKLLAVLPPDGDMETPLMILKVSATGLKAYDSYVASVARTFQRPPRGVLTTITFDPNVTYASLRFGNPRPCDKNQLALAFARKEEALQRLLTEPDVSAFAAETPAPKPKALQKPAARKPVKRAA
ncbi:hypothetical protein [Uliginosibacterium gangwonense]|uniref:hypothetical protein n=1 Tax=Uliginosibacterium gangwonense TaxID=392736 RepID=UPI0003792311|nr:hypothetical protein [Uliginosibacterium gangwonense]